MTESKDSPQPDFPVPPGVPIRETADGGHAVLLSDMVRASPLPQRKPLSEDEVRQLLRECVTVVAPGEVLVIRTTDLTPNQLREYQEGVTGWLDVNAPGIKALVIHGEGGQIVRVDPRDGVFTVDEARRLMGLPESGDE